MGFEVHNASIARNQRYGARDVVSVDAPLEHLMDSLQAFGREAGLFRFCVGQRRGHKRQCGEHQKDSRFRRKAFG